MTELSAVPHVVAAAVEFTDEAIVLRAQGGSLDAFTEIVARFEGRLFNFIARRVGRTGNRHADAEDLTQETFLRAWRSIGDYRPQCRFSTWLFTIASRLVVDHLRHQNVRAAAAETIADTVRQRSDDAAASEVSDSHSTGHDLWRIAVDILTHEQHAALWLRYAEDLSPGEVASVLNKNEVAVRVMLFRARQALAPYAAGAHNDVRNGKTIVSQDSRPQVAQAGASTVRSAAPGGIR